MERWRPAPEDRALCLKTTAKDGTAYNGFLWPESGYVEAPDWEPASGFGNGLHGLLDGVGNYHMLGDDCDSLWKVVEVARSECVQLPCGVVKFPRGNVIYSGGMIGAIKRIVAASSERLREHEAKSSKMAWHARVAKGIAATGHLYDDKVVSTGNSGIAVSSHDFSYAVTMGWLGRPACDGDRAKAVALGLKSRSEATGRESLAAVLGINGRAKAGPGGCLVLAWFDWKTRRERITVGYVGENGILADVWYGVNGKGELVEHTLLCEGEEDEE